MKTSIKKGLGFGLTSGIITTLGLIVGLNSGTNSKFVVIEGIIFIAIADSLSDALGIHVSEEAGRKNKKSVWESSSCTFLFKFIFALSFLIPVLLLNLQWAVIVSIVWGFLLLTTFSYYIAKQQNKKPSRAILEHVIIGIVVVTITHFAGLGISRIFS